MDASRLLMSAGFAILGVLGALHLIFTFVGNKLEPRDPEVRRAMENSALVITRQTSVWRATKGFNASHGLGMVSLALVFGSWLSFDPIGTHESTLPAALGMAILVGYLLLSRAFFFSTPFRSMTLACTLYAIGWALK